MTADMTIARTTTGALVAALMSAAFNFHRLSYRGYSWAHTAERRPDFVEGLFMRGAVFGDTLAHMVERVGARLGVRDEVLDRVFDVD